MLANGRSQFLLDRLGRCLKLFVSTASTSCHDFASQFGQYFFFIREHPPPPNTIANTESPRVVYLNEAPTSHCLASFEKGALRQLRHGWAHRTIEQRRRWGCVPVRECVCACACMHACVRDVFAIYTIIIFDQADNDNNLKNSYIS